MKTIILGAAGLLLSGTAMAGVPSKDMAEAVTATPVAAKDADTLNDSMIGNAITIDWPSKRADARAIDRKHIVTAAKALPEASAPETPSTAELSDSALESDDMTGVGGPDEPVATAAVAPANSYRACSPGRGDDNCIQLYEPGVSEAYAAWQANSGMPGTSQTAMGGPEEPVDTATADEAGKSGEEVAAYEPLPEDAVMPASADSVEKDSPDTMAI